MRRLNILVWHIHGSYLDALTSIEHNWYLPVKEGHYGGRRWSSPDYVREVPWDEVRNLDLDLIIFQSPRNYQKDQFEILTPEQRALPRIYLEHNTPRPHPVDTRHIVDDPSVLLVHVTQFNRLMWDNNGVPTAVVEHSVSIDPEARYRGTRARGITMVNGPQHRPRIAGLDLFFEARKQVPLDICGMETEEIGGLGDIKYFRLHRVLAEYRFLYSPMRYTSLPLAVIEAMTIGMPVVALATTELPTVIEDGVNGFISCDPGVLVRRMRWLIDHPYEAARMGAAARRTAEARFSLDRFARDWNAAFERAIEINRVAAPETENREAIRV
jgi:hypothetical protein